MHLVTEQSVRSYLANDPTSASMDAFSSDGDADLVCQKWLRDSAPKRMIFEDMYGDFLKPGRRLSVLDVGGGLTCFTRALTARHDYELVDILAHDDAASVQRVKTNVPSAKFHELDWFDFTPSGIYDVVVANDLFPNVDQRLQLFLQKFLPVSNEVRLSLTYYPNPRFYRTRRIEGDEFLCMLAWNGDATARALEPFSARISAPDLSLLSKENVSVYPNGRQVCILRMAGDRAPTSASNTMRLSDG